MIKENTMIPLCFPVPRNWLTIPGAIKEAVTFLTHEPPAPDYLTEFDGYLESNLVSPCVGSSPILPLECVLLGAEYALARIACQVGSFVICGRSEQQHDSTKLEINADVNPNLDESNNRPKND
jgi:hypothetical protein